VIAILSGRTPFYACLTLLSAFAAGLSLWALAYPHRPLEYMVAGTLATAIGLLGTFLWLARERCRRLRRIRQECRRARTARAA
jgi:hypothetical protein